MKFSRVIIRNEVAKRWPPLGWIKSQKVKKKIDIGISDTVIHEIIMKNEPALIGRMGGTEARFLWEYRKLKKLGRLGKFVCRFKPKWRKRSMEVRTIAGFYFNDLEDVEYFNKKYVNALRDVDILGAWGSAFTAIESDYFRVAKALIPVDYTAPWIEARSDSYSNIPWAQALRHKNVLVISPFTESIQKQFMNIANVFPGYSVHDFNLLTIKSPMTAGTAAPADRSWLQLLSEIESKISKIDFDVLLVSAGSYSFPLAHYAKTLGKIGIHCGGGLQLFFGIMGKRWEKSSYLNSLQIGWIRPDKNEKPVGADLIEGATYW